MSLDLGMLLYLHLPPFSPFQQYPSKVDIPARFSSKMETTITIFYQTLLIFEVLPLTFFTCISYRCFQVCTIYARVTTYRYTIYIYIYIQSFKYFSRCVRYLLCFFFFPYSYYDFTNKLTSALIKFYYTYI